MQLLTGQSTLYCQPLRYDTTLYVCPTEMNELGAPPQSLNQTQGAILYLILVVAIMVIKLIAAWTAGEQDSDGSAAAMAARTAGEPAIPGPTEGQKPSITVAMPLHRPRLGRAPATTQRLPSE